MITRIATCVFLSIFIPSGVYCQTLAEYDTIIYNPSRLISHDSLFNHYNLYLEYIPFPIPDGGAFSNTPDPIGRTSIFIFTPRLNIGFFPLKKFSIGWNLYTLYTISNIKFEQFAWKTGPIFRYYITFKKFKREIRWLALMPTFQYNFGNIQPIPLDVPMPKNIYHGIGVGLDWNFRLPKNFGLNVAFHAEYVFYPNSISCRKVFPYAGLGLNYTFNWAQFKRK